MKSIIWSISILVVAALFCVMARYELIVKPPVLVKMDRFSGKSWIVNSGYWVEVKDMPAAPAPETSQGTAETGKK